MRILIDLGHPAHVYLFLNLIREWKYKGYTCKVVARDKDITLRLLKKYGISYSILAPLGRSPLGQARELLQRELSMYLLAKNFRPILIIGTSVNASRVAKFVGAKSVIMNEDDAKVIPLFRWLAYPLATTIVTPDCLGFEDYGDRHLTYPGYHELFYLHPNRFTPDVSIYDEIGLKRSDKYAIIRLSALQAHHDINIRGINKRLISKIIQLVKDQIKIFITSEKPLSAEFEPYRFPIGPERMHDALAFAEFFLGDSQTMTAEAAVLGIPAFRFNDFVDRISYLKELEEYGLAFGFRPEEESHLCKTLEKVLKNDNRKKMYQQYRQKMLMQKIDPVPWFLQVCDMLVKRKPLQKIKTLIIRNNKGHLDYE